MSYGHEGGHAFNEDQRGGHTPLDREKIQLAADRFAWRVLAEQLLAVCDTFVGAQDVIDMSGFMDNHTDAARARKRQAEAVAEMRRLLKEAREGGRT